MVSVGRRNRPPSDRWHKTEKRRSSIVCSLSEKELFHKRELLMVLVVRRWFGPCLISEGQTARLPRTASRALLQAPTRFRVSTLYVPLHDSGKGQVLAGWPLRRG